MEFTIQIIGWLGTIFVITAYFLVSYKKVDGGSKIYQLLNLFGAIGVGVSVFHQEVWSAVALQVIWGIIAIIALAKTKNNLV
jgi:paired small multidrug resistance pump